MIVPLERVGADIVRVSLRSQYFSPKRSPSSNSGVNVQFIIHFDYRIALKVAEYGVDRLRINPGNIGNEERIRMQGGLRARQKHP